ncbi:endonuclease/exonuclease/phosphatase family protein [Leptolyngbyaceae cyanobacterium UHCC 1019]
MNQTVQRFGMGMIAGVVLLTGLSFVSYGAWNSYLELLTHFKLQYALLSLVLAIGLVQIRCRTWILISLFCLALQSVDLLVWYIPTSQNPASHSSTLKVLAVNVNIRNQNYDRVLELVKIESPDVAVFLETNDDWVKHLQVLRNTFPYFYRSTPQNFDILLYSRSPLTSISTNFLAPTDRPHLAATLTLNGQTITLIAIHPPPPLPRLFRDRNQQLETVSRYVQDLNTPMILLGDFNITPWSPYYRQFIHQTGLHNVRQGFGILPTFPAAIRGVEFPAWLVAILGIPIDHCLVRSLQPISVRVGAAIGSDHLPILVELRLLAR